MERQFNDETFKMKQVFVNEANAAEQYDIASDDEEAPEFNKAEDDSDSDAEQKPEEKMKISASLKAAIKRLHGHRSNLR